MNMPDNTFFSPFHDGPLNQEEIEYLKILVGHHDNSVSFIRDVIEDNEINNIVEIGSYIGNVMYRLRSKLNSVTLSEAVGDFERSDYKNWCEKNGFEFKENKIDQNGIKILDDNRRYDCFVALETLEHLPVNPKISIGSMSEMITRNGTIIISVPNRNSLAKIKRFFSGEHPYISFKNFYSDDPILANFGHHWLEYSIEDLDLCFKNAGFKRTHLKKCNVHYRSRINTFLKNVVSTVTGYKIYDQIYAAYRRS